MAKYGKWIGGGLGWVLGGPIGGLLGFLFGSMFDGMQSSQFEWRPPIGEQTGEQPYGRYRRPASPPPYTTRGLHCESDGFGCRRNEG